MNPEFWRDKKVFITGHTGFKGSWLSLWLQNLGAHVVGYSLSPPTRPSLFEVADVADGMVSIEGDVCDLSFLRSVLSEYKSEIVIHMAAQSLVRSSYEDPVGTYTTNVIGTVNLMEAVRLTNGVRVVVNVTSDKCYENKEHDICFIENDPMGGYDPYSSSKGCSELVTAAYRSSYFSAEDFFKHGVALATARAGNIVGGGDWAKDRLIPDVMAALMEDHPIIVRSPEAIRPWQHVLEPLDGYLTLAEKLWKEGPDFAEGWNFGPGQEDTRSVSWVVERLIREWGNKACWEVDGSHQLHEATFLNLDSSKARIRLDWSPKMSLETTMEWVVEWYKGFQNRADMRQLTTRQIVCCQNLERV